MPRPHPLPRAIAATSALLLALLAPLAPADQALRVVTWNVETVGTPGTAPYQAVAAGLVHLIGGSHTWPANIRCTAIGTLVEETGLDDLSRHSPIWLL